jgi:hypothetical protein
VREVNASTPELDVWGYLRPETKNPKVPEEEDTKKAKPRKEPHYWQERTPNYTTTCTIATVESGTTRCAHSRHSRATRSLELVAGKLG